MVDDAGERVPSRMARARKARDIENKGSTRGNTRTVVLYDHFGTSQKDMCISYLR